MDAQKGIGPQVGLKKPPGLVHETSTGIDVRDCDVGAVQGRISIFFRNEH
jgi:hypothetical protein